MKASGEGSSGSANEIQKEGVLLYYKYVSIPDVSAITKWYEDLCLQLKLVGRIRVSPEGVNVTIGGSVEALEEHIRSVSNHPGLGPCDFKVAECKEPLLADPILVEGCGFNALSVRAVQELVSLGQGASHVSHAEAGVHLRPAEFHEHILAASRGQNCASGPQDLEKQPIVILDARNVYETRIGHFQQLPGAKFVNPCIRQFSELPAWLDANEEHLRDKQVFMYCTGGVRCERASAYLRSKGPAFQSVYQLSGGIQRYLEAFPDGGLFAGKNFVFDPRVAVGSSDPRKVGRCLLCSSLYDDYSPRCRCSLCRLLVLVCDACREAKASEKVICELCQKDNRLRQENLAATKLTRDGAKCSRVEAEGECEQANGNGLLRERDFIPRAAPDGQAASEASVRGHSQQDGMPKSRDGNAAASAPDMKEDERKSKSERTDNESSSVPRRLRVLCLHGFRQTGHGLKGRLAAFQRGLKDLVEFVFVDAPHQLPCLYYARSETEDRQKVDQSDFAEEIRTQKAACHAKHILEKDREWERKDHRGSEERSAEEHRLESEDRVGCLRKMNGEFVKQASAIRPKFAWLVSPEQLGQIDGAKSVISQESAGGSVENGDREGEHALSSTPQFRQEASKESGSDGQERFRDQEKAAADWRPASGHFGPLQYKEQTAGWDNSLAYLQRVFSEQGPFDGVLGFSQGAAVAAALCSHLEDQIDFRFVVLCSGFSIESVAAPLGKVNLPSLHIFGGQQGKDRQIQVAESVRLADRFEPRQRVVVQHNAGHIVPTSKNYVDQYRTFCRQLLDSKH